MSFSGRASAVFVAVLLAFCLECSAAADSAFCADLNPAAKAGARAATAQISRSSAPDRLSPPPSALYAKSPVLKPGAVTVTDKSEIAISDDLDDYDSAPPVAIADPLESWNRFWFRFNDVFYVHIAQPVYKGWKFVTPRFFRTGMSNLFHNMLFPTRFINNILQFRFFEAGVEFSRFMMNMMGSAGLVNQAGNKKTIVPVDPSGEDFGQTLGRWGFGPGFYLVWPFIGPSSLRDTFGRIGDLFTDPLFYVHPWELSTGTEVFLRFNDLDSVLPAYVDLRSIAIDPYSAMRDAYVTLRQAQIKR